MKLSTKIILPIILISALLILLNGCSGTVPDGCILTCGDTSNCTIGGIIFINHAPEISNPPVLGQMVDILQTYTYDVDATDVDGDTLTYSLTDNPNGMVIDPSTGVITWPFANCLCLGLTEMGAVLTKGDRCYKLCDINVTVKVSDDGYCESLFDEESFIVEVWQP